MIERVVLIRLKPEFRSELGTVVQATLDTLGPMEQVQRITCGQAADNRTRGDWDVVITLRFDSMETVEAYRADATHRKYVDVFLKPMLERIYVYNFDAA